MGSTDSTVRTIIAVLIAILYYTGIISGTFGVVLLILASVFLLTSAVNYCPLYVPFGICTNKTTDSPGFSG